jgi:hypothetical protein
MKILIVAFPRVVCGLCALALGYFCVASAWEAGIDFAGLPAALGFSALAAGCWFIPSIISTTTFANQVLGWVVFAVGTLMVLTTSMGNAAKHRSANVGSAQTTITAYTQAEADLARLTRELDTMRVNPKRPGEAHRLWTATAGCSNDTLPESKDYCQAVRRTQRELGVARDTIGRGRPVSADPQAASLRKFIDATPDQINEWMPILLAIALEIGATGLMSLAFAPIKLPGRPGKPQEAPMLPPPGDPAWLSSTPLSGDVMPRYTRAHPIGRIDGRKLRWLPTNPRLNDNEAA